MVGSRVKVRATVHTNEVASDYASQWTSAVCVPFILCDMSLAGTMGICVSGGDVNRGLMFAAAHGLCTEESYPLSLQNAHCCRQGDCSLGVFGQESSGGVQGTSSAFNFLLSV